MHVCRPPRPAPTLLLESRWRMDQALSAMGAIARRYPSETSMALFDESRDTDDHHSASPG